MTLSLWRYAHLALAIISSLFLLILSVTGVILALDAAYDKKAPYRIDGFDSVTLAQSIPALRKAYPEIIGLSVDHNQFVALDATDAEGNNIQVYIDPLSGKALGPVEPDSGFIQWTTALHRSLFLHETGRVIVGVVSFLLVLITITGIILIIRRQQGIRHFFAKIKRDFFAQYFHVAGGRLLLIPVLALSLTGTYLFLVRIEVIRKAVPEEETFPVADETLIREPAEFPVFRQTMLADVEKIEFPFMEGDPEEFFVLKLKDRVISVHQLNGEIVGETKYPYAAILEKLSLDIHTGRTNALWALILAIASLNICAFIYTGFAMTFRRTKSKIKNRFRPDQAEIILLVGTENGSTLFFASQVHRQLLDGGKRSFLTEMNRFGSYPAAQHLLVFTSTYGLGTAPANADNFEKLLEKYPQPGTVQFSVLGFGSRSYPDFCGYARQVDEALGKQAWTSRYLDLHTVNDKSADDLVRWIHAWSEKSLVSLATAPALYTTRIAGLKKWKVVENTRVSDDNTTFKIVLKPESGTAFQSGDLLAVHPARDHRERFYSIGRNDGMVQLMVKLYPGGFGSGYLYGLETDRVIEARVVRNARFHFPEEASAVAMIANGTGIAPFLGMIMENRRQIPAYLYAGFRNHNTLTRHYQEFAEKEIEKKHLERFSIACSREEKPQYVMDLIRRDARFFVDLLENNGVIMICGSLKMHKDVEIVLDELCRAAGSRELRYFTDRNQILTDCY